MSASQQPPELFDGFIDPLEGHERLMFVGCVHAITDKFLWLLERIVDNPPHYLFFGGDLTGSDIFEELKMLFYECVFNRAHDQLGIGTLKDQQLSDEELINFVGDCRRSPTQTLGEGCRELLGYVNQLVSSAVFDTTMDTSQLARTIRHIANRDYFGSWHISLPKLVRQATAEGIEIEAQKLADALQPIRQAGTKIIMVGGNWDDVKNNQEGNWGSDVEVFDTVAYYQEQGFQFHSKVDVVQTMKTLVVSVPYWELARFDKLSKQRLEQAQSIIDLNRTGKTVIVVAHGEPNWEVHSLKSPIPSQEDRRTAISRLGYILSRLGPDELVYPHQHIPFSNKDGKRLPSRTKYQLIPKEDAVELVRDPAKRHRPTAITVSYLPFQRLGIVNIPLDDPDPRLKPHGNRDPMYVF